MAASPTAAPSPKTDGENALATLLAAAAAAMHRQQAHIDIKSNIPQNMSNAINSNKKSSYNNIICSSSTSSSSGIHRGTTDTNTDHQASSVGVRASNTNNNNTNRTIQKELEAKRDTLCQLLNLKPALELRNLESWYDEDGQPEDDSCYQDLIDPSNSNGWSADEMFKYNEKMHKIATSYNEKTLSDKYTTPLPKLNSKTTLRLASQLAREIEDRVLAEGRITPESSDDDELFEAARLQRIQQKQKHQSDQTKSPSKHRLTNGQAINSNAGGRNKIPSQHKKSTETSTRKTLSSSPMLNGNNMKPVTSSSRNILRTSLSRDHDL